MLAFRATWAALQDGRFSDEHLVEWNGRVDGVRCSSQRTCRLHCSWSVPYPLSFSADWVVGAGLPGSAVVHGRLFDRCRLTRSRGWRKLQFRYIVSNGGAEPGLPVSMIWSRGSCQQFAEIRSTGNRSDTAQAENTGLYTASAKTRSTTVELPGEAISSIHRTSSGLCPPIDDP